MQTPYTKVVQLVRPECDQRCDIQQHDANLVEGHAGIVNRVKSLSRKVEPSAVETIHWVVSKTDYAKPDDEDRGVVSRAEEPQKIRANMCPAQNNPIFYPTKMGRNWPFVYLNRFFRNPDHPYLIALLVDLLSCQVLPAVTLGWVADSGSCFAPASHLIAPPRPMPVPLSNYRQLGSLAQ